MLSIKKHVRMAVTPEVILQNLYVNTLFGRDLFESILKHYGKDGWNAFVGRLRRHSLYAAFSSPEPESDEDACMPICMRIDMTEEKFHGKDLSGLDLTLPELDHAQFRGADLRLCRFGSVAYASFSSSNLRGAQFDDADITGADFSNARIDVCSLAGAWYDRDTPPTGLREDQLKNCHLFPAHWDRNEDPSAHEPCHPLQVKAACLKSFWGAVS